MTRTFLVIIAFILVSCHIGKLPDKDTSESNISYVELDFPKAATGEYPNRLDESALTAFAKILAGRKPEYVEPTNCYNLLIKLKGGSSVHYLTDGVKFQGYDGSSDCPFPF